MVTQTKHKKKPARWRQTVDNKNNNSNKNNNKKEREVAIPRDRKK